jgi:hypothetical protein
MNNEPFRPSFLKNRKAAKPKELFTFESVAEIQKKKIKEQDGDGDGDGDEGQRDNERKREKKEEREKEGEEEGEEEEEESEKGKKHKTFGVDLIDDSRTAVLDRRLILERIHPGFLVRTNIESISPPEIVTDKMNEPKTHNNTIQTKPVKTVNEIILSNSKLLEHTEKDAKKTREKKDKVDKDDDKGVAEDVAEEAAPQPQKKSRKRGKMVITELDQPNEINPVGPNLGKIQIGKQTISDRLPPPKKLVVRVSPYYMNNRRKYVQKIAETFRPYSAEILAKTNEITCANRDQNINFDLLTHQSIVKDYLNLYTPYRGLLLYHGLGSGKTCTSIAIAEGMKTQKRVYIMTPASLKMNFFSELKKCADHLYRKNQFWEFVGTEGQPDLVTALSAALQLPKSYIEKHRGAWFVDVKKASNFGELSENDQKNIDAQLNEMIRVKYIDINYNGLNVSKLNELTKDNTVNPFDHSVIIIDEAHNFVSRVVNKINRPKSISSVLYHHLMNAVDARVVFLTGTPIINYPNEIGVLFNMLRGYIKTWEIQVNITTKERVNRDTILDIFKKEGIDMYDYVEYSGNKLTITKNPYGFVNVYKSAPGAAEGRTKKKGGDGDGVGMRSMVEGGKGSKKNKTKKKISVSDADADTKTPTPTPTPKKKTKRASTKKKINIITDKQTLYDIRDGIVIKNPQIGSDIKLKDEEKVEYFEKHNDLYDGGGMGDTDDTFKSYRGIQFDEDNRIDDVQFIERIKRVLPKYGINPLGDSPPNLYKCLPDVKDKFIETFIDGDAGNVKEIDLFKRRILGLTSYFRSAQEQLLPSFVMTDDGKTYHIVMCEMSNFQFGVYEKIRKDERDQEKQNKKKKKKGQGQTDDIYEISSTYRIFSRACCNFAFPDEQKRPLPDMVMHDKIDQNDFNGLTHDERKKTDEYIDDAELVDEPANEKDEVVLKKIVKVPGSKIVKKREDADAKAEAKADAKAAKEREKEAKKKVAEDAKAAKEREKEAKKKAAEDAKAAKEQEKEAKKKAAEDAKEAKRLEKEAKKKKGGVGSKDDDKDDDDDVEDIEEKEDEEKEDEEKEEKEEEDVDEVEDEVEEDVEDIEEDDDDKDGSLLSNEEILEYQKRIQIALDFLKYNHLKPREKEYLTSDALETYSPKFKKVLENLTDESNSGIHLVYSNFRTIEGVGLLKLILEAAGLEEFKLVRTADNMWDLPSNLSPDKQRFVLYTGTETPEEKEIIRNIYNSTWHLIPQTMSAKLRKLSENNFMGNVIKIMMITSSGAEGINLRNTRFVHIIEPYWNMVRLEQVIGRARRICSHEDLPPDMRNVKVFCYISTLTEEQRTNEKHIELRINDVSRITKTPITTDEYLFEVANIKNNINQQILKSVKETAIDCSLYNSSSNENLVCYFANIDVKTNMFLSYPTLEMDKTEKVETNTTKKATKITKITIGKDEYAWDQVTNNVYLYDNFKNARDKKDVLKVYGHFDRKTQRVIPDKA